MLISSDTGLVFQVNYDSKELEGVFQLHEGAIFSITVTDRFFVTAAEDCFLRVWPLDFSEFLLETKTDSWVYSVAVNSSNSLVAYGSSNCSLSILNMETKACKTIIWSHTSEIVGLEVQHSTGLLLTISLDNTFRI